MYSAPYGYPNAPAPVFNGAPQQNPHMQPGPNQQQQMMYNPQQLPMGAQGMMPGGPNMMPGAAPGNMMPNPGMPHMAPNGQSMFAFSSSSRALTLVAFLLLKSRCLNNCTSSAWCCAC